jgi:hypothetical protein
VPDSWFGYKWDACERDLVLATDVTPDLGAWSCLDVV